MRPNGGAFLQPPDCFELICRAAQRRISVNDGMHVLYTCDCCCILLWKRVTAILFLVLSAVIPVQQRPHLIFKIGLGRNSGVSLWEQERGNGERKKNNRGLSHVLRVHQDERNDKEISVCDPRLPPFPREPDLVRTAPVLCRTQTGRTIGKCMCEGKIVPWGRKSDNFLGMWLSSGGTDIFLRNFINKTLQLHFKARSRDAHTNKDCRRNQN